MALKQSKRSDIPSFRALDILQQVNQRVSDGENIIRLEAGQPSVGAPLEVIEYAKEMLDKDPIQGYTASVGMPELRERISGHYRLTDNCDVSPDSVFLSVGSSAGFILSFIAAFDEGDTVVLTTPTYPAYRNILKSLNINVIEVETTMATNYQPTVEILSNINQKIDGVIIASPSNPAGTIIDPEELKAICRWADEAGVRLVSDEAYHGITYEETAQSMARYSKTGIITNTFSKYFAMTGWRLGWMIIPEDLRDRVKKLSESLFVSPPSLSQHVAYKIFDHLDVCENYVATYRKNRDLLRAGLPKAGFENLSAANGAFYYYIDVHNLTNDSQGFCREMLDHAGVSATPGLDFDVARGNATIRMSYAGRTEDIEEACYRLQKWRA